MPHSRYWTTVSNALDSHLAKETCALQSSTDLTPLQRFARCRPRYPAPEKS
jgi:hypothetical protein